MKWKSTKQHTQNEMKASLSLCKNTAHRLEMEGGGWRAASLLWKGEKRGGHEMKRRVEVNEEKRRVTVVKGDGDSHLCGELPAAAVGSHWRPSPARYSGGRCLRLRCPASPGPPGRTGAGGSEVWARETGCWACGRSPSPWWPAGFSAPGGTAGSCEA